jgi:hypothetical protein
MLALSQKLDPSLARFIDGSSSRLQVVNGKPAVAEVSGLPVFDINIMINWFYRATNPIPFLR